MSQQIVFGIKIEGVSSAISTQKQLTDAIKSTKQALDTQADPTKQKQLQRQLGQLTAAQTSFRNQVKAATKDAQANAQVTDRSVGAYRKLSAQLGESRNRMKDLAAAGKTNTNEFKKLNKEVTQLDQKLKRVDAQAGQFQRNVGNYPGGGIGGALRSIGGGAAQAGLGPAGMMLGGSAAAGMAISGFLAANISTLADYETGLKNLQAVTGSTDTEMKKFSKTIQDVARETKQSSIVVADAFGIVGSAQPELLKNADALGEVTKQAIILSKAGGIDLVQAAGSLTKAMNQFGVGAEDAAKFTDILATSQQLGTSRIDALSEALKVSGSTANTVGLTFEETTAALQGLAKAGLEGSAAGTGLQAVMLRLSKEGKGFTTGQFNLIEAVRQSKAEYEAIQDPIERTTFLTDLFGQEHIKTGAALMSQVEVIEDLTAKTYELGNAQSQADTRSDTLRVKVEELNNQYKNMVIALQEGQSSSTEFFKGYVQDADNALTELTGLFEGHVTLIEMLFGSDGLGPRELIEKRRAQNEPIVDLFDIFNFESGQEEINLQAEEAGEEAGKAVSKGIKKAIEKRPLEKSFDGLKLIVSDLKKDIQGLDPESEAFINQLNKLVEAEQNLAKFEDTLDRLRGKIIAAGRGEVTPLAPLPGVGGLPASLSSTTQGGTGIEDGIKAAVKKQNALVNEAERKEFEDRLKFKQDQDELIRQEAINAAGGLADSLFDITHNRLQREFDAEIEALNRRTQAKLHSVEKGSADETKILRDAEKEREEINKNAAKKEQNLAIKQALVNSALAITRVFASTAPPASFILAALVGAQALAQVAAIRSQGFAEGGYTGNGSKYEPAGIVHKGEVVFSKKDVALMGGAHRVDGMRPTSGTKGYADGGIGGMPQSFTQFQSGSMSEQSVKAIAQAVMMGAEMGVSRGTREAEVEKTRFDRLRTRNIAR